MCKQEKHAGLKLISLDLQVKTSHVNMPLMSIYDNEILTHSLELICPY